jgi:undecaprenyl-diphosphatase
MMIPGSAMRMGTFGRGWIIAIVMVLVTFNGVAAAIDRGASPDAEKRNAGAMTVGQAVILGIVEGLTEYLPVSSTGHLLLAERIMGIGDSDAASEEQRRRTKDAANAYTICIQAGAIIAVLGLYFRRVRQMLLGLAGKDPRGSRLLVNVAAGFIPAAVIGLLFNKIIKACLFGPWPVVAAWFVGGLAILVVSRRNRKAHRPFHQGLSLDDLTWRMALCIGFAQCIAMWPGVSRSLVTIVGGLLVGMSMSSAVEFSFLLGVVTLGAATAYDALKQGALMLQTFDALPIAVGLVCAFIAAVASVKWMVAYLNRHGLEVFGYYRVALAVVTALWITVGTL